MCSLVFMVACQKQKDVVPEEPVKDLVGKWALLKVVRNSVDITPYIDTTGFRLNLNSDETYTLENNDIPFVINSGGTWSADDPIYPYHISFKGSDSTNTVVANVATPVSKGKRNLDFTFSPGCLTNTYVYSFSKIQ